MAHSKSALKRIRQNERNRQRNVAVKSRMKTYIKQALDALEGDNAETRPTAVAKAISEIDRAASKGVIHANSAARKKSMIQRRATAAQQQ